MKWPPIKSILDKLHRTSSPPLETLGLVGLYPKHDNEKHDIYILELNKAVDDESVSNIALTGGYGSGKSSILAGFVESRELNKKQKGRAIQISLSTLGQEAVARIDTEGRASEEQTNAIQKEIIKQLLFKEPPQKVPRSKFKRIAETTVTLRIILLAALVTVVAFSVAYFCLGLTILEKMTNGVIWQQVFLVLDLIITFFALAILTILMLGNNFIVSKFSSGPVTLSRTDKNNYFDQYLDELIYFFQVTKYEIVIFEDIERFDNTDIFRTLKQLNSLLNESEQIKQRKKQIKFIYAIKDSLFSSKQADLTSAYEQSTDRAKFFDIIIPVVPFLTHQNSADIFIRMFNTDDSIGISKELISTVSRYITDMRLIKNIYNEYLIFAKNVLGKNRLEGLTKDKLFAMVVYKNTNLKDFEKIKLGSSNLDTVYQEYRRCIGEEMVDINTEIRNNKAKLEAPESLVSRSANYGQKLIDFVELTTSSLQNTSSITYNLQGANYALEQMKTIDFWNIASKMRASDNFVISYTSSTNYGRQQEMHFNREKLEQIISESLDTSELEETDRETIRNENKQLRKALKDTRHKSIEQLMNTSPDFREFVQKNLNEEWVYSELIYALLQAGCIDAYFTLYTSIFHGTNPKATNFLIHNLQLDKADFFYKFDDDANVEALISDGGGSYARSKATYNIDIVDYILKTAKSHPSAHLLHHMTSNIAQGETEDKQFLDAYINNGRQPKELVKLLGKWPEVFEYIILNSAIEETRKVTLFNAALEGSSKDIHYRVGETVSKFVITNASRFEALSQQNSPIGTESLQAILLQLDIKLTSFKKLNTITQDIITRNSLYVINQDNLEAATGRKNLSLDNILSANEVVFEYVVANIPSYLGVMVESKKTKYVIDDATNFAKIINQVAQSAPEYLEEIIKKSSPTCSVKKLSDISSEAWPFILDIKATEPTLSNIMTYYQKDDSKTLDQHLLDYLNNEERIEVGAETDADATEEVKEGLAISILNSELVRIPIKSKLVGDLDLGEYISVDKFNFQNGGLYGHLLAEEVIEDTAETYNLLKSTNILTRTFYIENSDEFMKYIQDIAFDVEEINAIAASTEVKPDIKKYFVDNLVKFESELSTSSAANLAEFALTNNMSLKSEILYLLADGANFVTIVKLINASQEAIERDGLIRILTRINHGYEKLTQPKGRPALSDTEYHVSLLERLKNVGLVSSYTHSKTKGQPVLKVNMKNGW